MTQFTEYQDDDGMRRIAAHGNNSTSTNASGLQPSMIRLAWKNKTSLLWTVGFLAAVVVGLVFGAQFNNDRSYFLAGLFFCPTIPSALGALACGFYFVMSVRMQSMAISSGLLTPGIVS